MQSTQNRPRRRGKTQAACETSRSIGLLIVDIDQFKRFNQVYGTEYGDATLKVISRLLQNKLEQIATELEDSQQCETAIGRYDGDSFLLLLSGGTELTLATLAKETKLAINALKIENKASKHNERLTVSQGYVCFKPDAGTRAEQMMEYARIAVSAAKQDGGNNIVAQKPSERIYWDRQTAWV